MHFEHSITAIEGKLSHERILFMYIKYELRNTLQQT